MAEQSRKIIDDARRIAEQRQPEEVRANREAAQPLVDELARAGFEIAELGDLPLERTRRRKQYRTIVPILVRWLQRMDNTDVRLAIVLALAVPEARPDAVQPLIDAFEAEDCNDRRGFHVKSQIAYALSVVADDTAFKDIVRLIRDERHGQCRQNLVWALGNVKNPEAKQVLLEVLQSRDALIAPHALRPLGRLRVTESRQAILSFLSHSDPWVRHEARRALAKIDKTSG
jgi:HEAT repeat protein